MAKEPYVQQLIDAGAHELRCRECAYRARQGEGRERLWYTCEFMLLTGQRRGCDAVHCTRFTPMTQEIEQYLERARRGFASVGTNGFPLESLALRTAMEKEKKRNAR